MQDCGSRRRPRNRVPRETLPSSCQTLGRPDMCVCVLHTYMLSLFPSIANAFAASESSAPRFWPKYVGSHTATLLDGTWAYGLHDGVDAADPKLDVTAPSWTPNSTSVPSCIDAVPPGYLGPRATAVYRTTFKQSSTHARLWFGACSFYCRVWVNGKEIGDHRAGGYGTYGLIPPRSAAQHRVWSSIMALHDVLH